jgi:hypothetical protein
MKRLLSIALGWSRRRHPLEPESGDGVNTKLVLISNTDKKGE